MPADKEMYHAPMPIDVDALARQRTEQRLVAKINEQRKKDDAKSTDDPRADIRKAPQFVRVS